MAMRRALCLLGTAGVLTAGCGGSQEAPVQEQPAGDTLTEDTNLSDLDPFVRLFTPEGLLLVASDINVDGRPDNFEFLAVLDEGDNRILEFEELSPYDPLNLRIVRKEIDVNFDGNVDVVRTYNRQQRLIREELDVNFNQSVDFINHFEDAIIVRRQLDRDADGVFEETRYYRAGSLYRIEKDSDNDFIPDYWEFYLEGVLARIGRDYDADGIIDNWILAETNDDSPDIVRTDERGNIIREEEPEEDDASEDEMDDASEDELDDASEDEMDEQADVPNQAPASAEPSGVDEASSEEAADSPEVTPTEPAESSEQPVAQ